MLNTKLWPTHDQAKTAQTSLVSAANYLLQIIAALILNINKPLNHVCLYLLKRKPNNLQLLTCLQAQDSIVDISL